MYAAWLASETAGVGAVGTRRSPTREATCSPTREATWAQSCGGRWAKSGGGRICARGRVRPCAPVCALA
eukprot:6624368-Prymnesium_polylepis.1